jgi:subfamily B ATP-binding cassette protein MsbA
MKIFFRILQYAPGIRSQLAKFLLYSVLASGFSAIYLGLLQPMLDILFIQKLNTTVTELPEFSLSVQYGKDVVMYYFSDTLQTQGLQKTLMYVCLFIVAFVFLSNLFRYMERMVASREIYVYIFSKKYRSCILGFLMINVRAILFPDLRTM